VTAVVPTVQEALVPVSLGAVEPQADQNPAAVYLARLAPGTRRSMKQALEVMAGVLSNGKADSRSFPWPKLQHQPTQAVRAWLAEKYAPATTNKFLAALRGVLKESFRLGLMSPDDYARAREVEGVKGTTLPAGREVTPGELVALFRVCAEDSTPAGARDAALLALLYGGGLRRSEVAWPYASPTTPRRRAP